MGDEVNTGEQANTETPVAENTEVVQEVNDVKASVQTEDIQQEESKQVKTAETEKAEKTADKVEGGIEDLLEDDEQKEELADGEGETDKSDRIVFDTEKLNLPKGMEISEEIADAVGKMAAKNGYTQEQSGSLAEMWVEAKSIEMEKQAQVIQETRVKMINECKTDPEFSGEDGTQYKSTLRFAKKALQSTPAGQRLMEKMKGGAVFSNDKDLLLVLAERGKLTSEDVGPRGKSARKPYSPLNKYNM